MELAFACIVAGVWAFLTITLGKSDAKYSVGDKNSDDNPDGDHIGFDSLDIGGEASTFRILAALWRRGLEEPTLREMTVPWSVWNWG